MFDERVLGGLTDPTSRVSKVGHRQAQVARYAGEAGSQGDGPAPTRQEGETGMTVGGVVIEWWRFSLGKMTVERGPHAPG